jgi:hypothetical protein
MEPVTLETPTAAERELEIGIQQLKEAIARVPEEDRAALEILRQPLTRLEAAMLAEDPKDFLRGLMDLAQAVIDVRKSASLGRPLAELPVPPYDLWLPFKAAAARPHEGTSPERYVMRAVRNKKMLINLPELLKQLGSKPPEASTTGEG